MARPFYENGLRGKGLLACTSRAGGILLKNVQCGAHMCVKDVFFLNFSDFYAHVHKCGDVWMSK